MAGKPACPPARCSKSLLSSTGSASPKSRNWRPSAPRAAAPFRRWPLQWRPPDDECGRQKTAPRKQCEQHRSQRAAPVQAACASRKLVVSRSLIDADDEGAGSALPADCSSDDSAQCPRSSAASSGEWSNTLARSQLPGDGAGRGDSLGITRDVVVQSPAAAFNVANGARQVAQPAVGQAAFGERRRIEQTTQRREIVEQRLSAPSFSNGPPSSIPAVWPCSRT